MKRNKAEASRSNTHAGEHLSRAGFVYCGSCGRKLYAQTMRSQQDRYICPSRFGREHTCVSGANISAPMLDEDIWQKVLIVLNTDVAALALLERSGDGDGAGGSVALQGLRSRLSSYDGTIEQHHKRRRMLKRQQVGAYDDAEYDELEASIKQVSDRLHALVQERDEVAETIEPLEVSTRAVAPLVKQIRIHVPMPKTAPRPGQPGFEAAFAEALLHEEERQRGKAVTRLTVDLTVAERRAILRWLGARVDVYREGFRDTRWKLHFASPEGAGPFPLAEPGMQVIPTSSTAP
jgi:Recombinase zinc beta ribbon domain